MGEDSNDALIVSRRAVLVLLGIVKQVRAQCPEALAAVGLPVDEIDRAIAAGQSSVDRPPSTEETLKAALGEAITAATLVGQQLCDTGTDDREDDPGRRMRITARLRLITEFCDAANKLFRNLDAYGPQELL